MLERPEVHIRVVMGGGRELASLNQLSEGDYLSDLEEFEVEVKVEVGRGVRG